EMSGQAPVRDQTSGCVLWLLICKTARFQLCNALTIVIIIAGPIGVFLIYSATVLVPAHESEVPMNFTTEVPYIYYSPRNFVIDGVINEVVRNVKAKGSFGYSRASSLNDALRFKDGFVGIEFEDSFGEISELPNKVKVALRFPLHLRTKPKLHWGTEVIYKHRYLSMDAYLGEGFLQVQVMLSRALIRAKNEGALLPEVELIHFPNSRHQRHSWHEKRLSMGWFLFLPFTISAAYLAQMIVVEKEEHLNEMLQLLGVRVWIHWLSWFVVAFALFTIPTVVVVMLLKWRFYPLSAWTLVLFFFFVYIVELLCSTFMICAIFSDPISVQVAILALHLMSWLPWRLLIMGYQADFLRFIMASLFLNSSLTIGMEELRENETLWSGMNWGNLFLASDRDDAYTLGILLVTMMVGSVVRILICAYVEELNGVRKKKWYYPVQPSFWCRRCNRDSDVEKQEDEGNPTPSPKSRTLVVRARNLAKIYNGVRVVDNFTMDFYQDEITVFLGHHDSGKTTIFMMLAGIQKPSHGGVTINGFDLVTERWRARQSLSLCPQNNVLFEKQKVRWHLNFYSRMKGMNRTEAALETDKYLEAGHLQEYAKSKVMELSSGMKRMLSLCCSLCGHSKLLLLDEPGTSLDPLVRRAMWDLLRRERMGRCILVNTHHMLEAEVLADRIVLMCDGSVFGYGTTSFLTQIADEGAAYLLTCTKVDTCLAGDVTRFLQRRLPDIKLDAEDNTYVSYELPMQFMDQFSDLFDDLEEAMDQLGIMEFFVSAPTLSTVFLRIGAELKERRDRSITLRRISRSTSMSSLLNLLPTFEYREDNDLARTCNHWRAVMLKKWRFTVYYKKFFTMIILLPFITCLLVFIVELIIFAIDFNGPPLQVTDLSNYSAPTVAIGSSGNTELAKVYEQMALSKGAVVKITEDGKTFYNYFRRDEARMHQSFVAALSFKAGGTRVIAWENQKLEHGSPLALGLAYDALARWLAQMEIEIVNKPRRDGFASVLASLGRSSTVELASLVLLYLILATATFTLMPVLERRSDMHHLQLISGVSRTAYWVSHMVWDFCVFILMILTLVLASGLISSSSLPLFILLLAFGFSVITFTYLLCLLSTDPGRLFSIVLYVNMLGKWSDPELPMQVHRCRNYIFCYLLSFTGVLALFIHPNTNERRFAVLEPLLMLLPHYALFSDLSDNMTEVQYLFFTGMLYLLLILLAWVPRRINYLFKYFRNESIEPKSGDEDIDVSRVRHRVSYITGQLLKTCPLVLRKVSRRYGDLVAVRCLTLDLNPSECVGLLGRNGAGKTSTLNMIVGKRAITTGRIHIMGNSMKSQPRSCFHHVGFCPREPQMAYYLTGREMLRFTCLINGIRRGLIKDIVDEMEEKYVLGQRLDRLIETYNSGTKRKLMIALASLAPTLICLDEPTAGVDVSAKYDIWHMIDCLRLAGRCILFTSHSTDECEMLCTSLGILDRGSMLCYGMLARLRRRFDKGIFVKVKVGTLAELAEIEVEVEKFTKVARVQAPRTTTIGSLHLSLMHSLTFLNTRDFDEDFTTESSVRKDYERLLRAVEHEFSTDHPYSTVRQRLVFRGMITFFFPKDSIKYSEIFSYMEECKTRLQILYYSISHTNLEDVFLEFVTRHNQ
ncbi:hypothetical protein KR009_000677, partial [Drosophila setifemur]